MTDAQPEAGKLPRPIHCPRCLRKWDYESGHAVWQCVNCWASLGDLERWAEIGATSNAQRSEHGR